MTLIAAISSHPGVPTILSDLLVSMDSGNPRARPVPLATVDTAHSRMSADGSTVATDLYQKVVIIAPNCAVAMAGDDFAQCLEAVRGVYGLAKRGPLTMDGVERHLARAEECGLYPGASLVGLVVEGAKVSVLKFRAKYVDTDGAFHMSAAGSGVKFLKMAVMQAMHPRPLSSPNSPLKDVERAAIIGALLLGIENSSGATIREGFGGGYEIVYYHAGEQTFKRLSDITYCSWEAKYDPRSDDGGCLLRLAVRQVYVDDVLIIRGLRASPGGRALHEFSATIMPIDLDKPRHRRRPHRSQMPAATKFSAHCVVAIGPGGPPKTDENVPVFALFGQTREGVAPTITFEPVGISEDRVKVVVSDDFRDQMRARLRATAAELGW